MRFKALIFISLFWAMTVVSFADDESKTVALSQTPAAVQTAIKAQAGDGQLGDITRVLDDGETNYDVALTSKDGREKDFTVADDGTLLSVEVGLSETPDAVQKTIATQMNGGKLESIDKNLDDDGTSYDVEITAKDGREKSFNVAADGSLSSIEVTLEETPPAVQKTIKNRIGDGKILQIDRSFVEKHGVLPYEVQGLKDGKPFNFSVGPKGRFLGMDD